MHEKYYVEIDYEGVYDFDWIDGDLCHYTLFSYEERMVYLDTEITYRVFTPVTIWDIEDLRRALLKASKLFVDTTDDGALVDYNEDCPLSNEDSRDMVDTACRGNILELFERGSIGTFSKEKTITLREFLKKYDFDVPPLAAKQKIN